MSAASEVDAGPAAPGRGAAPRRDAPSIALAGVAAIAVLALALGQLVGGGAPFLVLTIAVILGTWYGGRVTGVIAVALTAVAGLVSTRGASGVAGGAAPGDTAALLLVHLAVGAVLVALTDRARAAQLRLAARAEALASAERRHRRVLDPSEGGASIADALRRAEIERDRLRVEERRARAEADAASRAKDEFLAIVSHELRTPLNAVLGWASLLSRDLPPETRAKAVSAIQRSARAQAQLIEDLLDTSRMRAGKLTLDRRPTPVAPCVRAALEAIGPEAAARGVELRPSIPDELPDPAVLGDAHRIQQLVGNLLSNAVKFTPRGRTVHLDVRARQDVVEIVVRDEGAGIDPELLPTLFDPFRPGEAGSTKRHGGLGLGLAIVRHLVAEHGGTVEAQSPGEGKGATFSVVLPRVPVTIAPGPEARTTPGPRALQGLEVLLVDDDADGRDALAEVLTRAGATVRAAGSVEQAWREIREEGRLPDVLVSDLAMPEDDGVDLVRRVRSLPRAAGGAVPALAVSAHARSADRSRASAAGFDRHLAKPVDPEELVRAVAELARAASSERATPATAG